MLFIFINALSHLFLVHPFFLYSATIMVLGSC
uniref:Uncharacterized protein n=1 Tax=Rhizophora mucronata TaxID=61149 RepID=A0A2P2LFP6_RHIMU